MKLTRLFLALCLTASQLLAAEPAKRPNILLILADNWSWPHASALGDKTVRTPAFDRLVAEGALFAHAFCPVPSCSPTRASLLTGRPAHQLEDAASLNSSFSTKFATFPALLRDAGYAIGHGAKGWGPGDYEVSGRTENPAGPRFGPARYSSPPAADGGAKQDREQFAGFAEFMEKREKERPFFFWLGFTHPSRPTWAAGSGAARGLRAESVAVPPCLPDVPEVRGALLDYYASIERLDALIAQAVQLLAQQGLLENTLIVCASDNGWQMPRGLANVYDTGTRVPLVIRWPGRATAGARIEEFVSLTDLAPTFLEAGGVTPPSVMTGRSLLPALAGRGTPRDAVFLERERHANVREGHLGYPIRAIRTADHLYIRNLQPDRWPAGDPTAWFAVGDFGDVDDSPAKRFILAHRDDPKFAPHFAACFAKRPAEELYDLRTDPAQLTNLAADPAHAATLATLRTRVDDWMRDTADPRAGGKDAPFDRYPYLGKPTPGARGIPAAK